MSENKLNESALYQLDICFLDILKTMILSVENACGEAAEFILKSSSQFISEKAQGALEDFHSLYYGGGDVDAQKEAMNVEVDDLVANIQAKMDAGEDVDSLRDSVEEDEEDKKNRLGLSGIQKELETLVQLDSGIKEKLLPVLTSMQFEDMIRHRLDTIDFSWEQIIEELKGSSEIDKEKIMASIEAKLTSNDERQLFYKLVKKEEPPKDMITEDNVWLDFAAD